MKLSSTNYPKERTIVVDPASQSISWEKSNKVEGSLSLDRSREAHHERKEDQDSGEGERHSY
jgi:peptide deformylase